ncbi:MAG: tRNA (cytidine(34)-2'-O)-methyltransferase [Proteobacteria bacterium]|nr:tRNA (cytidine(34)-2'-O)-methyltransferase [Pseudomonadota bacterium]NBY20162.1 tRNA (cytidine(34)-2'-O)-methyltransferase [bacterium]
MKEKNSLNIVLYQPVIPQNTGSIARLCACTGASLHLIHPLGFQVDDASLKRAGLDYWPFVDVNHHESWEAFVAKEEPKHLTLYTKFATMHYTTHRYETPTYLVFGSETKGLPPEIHKTYADKLYKIPMRTSIVRSLNLAQSAAIVLYEVIRQHDLGSGLT